MQFSKFQEKFISILKNKFTLVPLIILIIIFSALFIYKNKTSDSSAQKEVVTLTNVIGKLMVLPRDEAPTVATIVDKTKLLNQPFFAHAENGDKVLFYTKSQRAILYRPSVNKIVDVSNITVANKNEQVAGASTSSPTQAPTEKARVAIYNGTTTNGLTLAVSKSLISKLKDIEVKSRDNAKKRDYEKTIVVDLTGKFEQTAQEITSTLNAEVATLPEGETQPKNIEILIIVGKDQVK